MTGRVVVSLIVSLYAGFRLGDIVSTRWGTRRLTLGRLSMYIEPRDLWIGVYVGPDATYLCLLPTVVLRWRRNPRKDPG